MGTAEVDLIATNPYAGKVKTANVGTSVACNSVSTAPVRF